MSEPFKHIFWERGFRPFFLFGAIYTVCSMLIWTAHMHGAVLPDLVFDNPIIWHGHEMVFGFTMAIVSGFLLTAVANWTGWAPVREAHLAGLCLLWVAGRVVMHLPSVPFALFAVIELSFIPALAVSLAVPLLKSWNKRNFVFLFLLSVMLICQGFVIVLESRTALYIAVFVIISMISLIGGRVIPTFTISALRMKGKQVKAPPQPRMDIACLISLVLLMGSFAVSGESALTGMIAFVSAALHAFRIRYYNLPLIWGEPMLWILHLGYLWLVAGLFLLGLAGFSVIPVSPALHALTAGSIGSMTIGMMARVSLGHTGRALVAGKAMVAAFAVMQLAALARVAGPLVMADQYLMWIGLSGTLWATAFALYVFVYAPVLWGQRQAAKPRARPTQAGRYANMRPVQEDD